jgi:hypothetical protein
MIISLISRTINLRLRVLLKSYPSKLLLNIRYLNTTSSSGSQSSIALAPTSITRSQSSTAQSSASRRVSTTASTSPLSVVTSLTVISRSNSSRIPSATPTPISASTSSSSSSGIQSNDDISATHYLVHYNNPFNVFIYKRTMQYTFL